MTIYAWLAIVGVAVSVIGVVLGATAHVRISTKMENLAQGNTNSTVTQAHTINNGLSATDVVSITEKAATEHITRKDKQMNDQGLYQAYFQIEEDKSP